MKDFYMVHNMIHAQKYQTDLSKQNMKCCLGCFKQSVKGSFSVSNAQVISRASKDLLTKISPPGFLYAAASIVRASQ